jgi:hypothetical protein
MTVDKRNKFEEEIFTFRETKSHTVFIYWYGKQVTILSREKAKKFVAKVKIANPVQQQILMAKETGNFKRGNER